MVVLGHPNGNEACVFGFTWGRSRCFDDLSGSEVSLVMRSSSTMVCSTLGSQFRGESLKVRWPSGFKK